MDRRNCLDQILSKLDGKSGLFKEKKMGKVNLYIYPPLFGEKQFTKPAALLIQEEITRGETLENLIGRLANRDQPVWARLVDAQKNRLRPGILLIVNGVLFRTAELSQIAVTVGDKIEFRLTYSGG